MTNIEPPVGRPDPFRAYRNPGRVLADNPSWPPPRRPDDEVRQVWVFAADTGPEMELVECRSAVLWQQQVWIDDLGRPFCDGCRRFVELEEAMRGGHRVGLPPMTEPFAWDGDDDGLDRRGDSASFL